MSELEHRSAEPALDADVIIVGAGISGIGAGIELKRWGQLSFVLLESAQELGGTWRDNTYPGVAVDIPFTSYCYPFETKYPWSRIFPEGSEIQQYIKHCAVKYGIVPHIRFGSDVTSSRFDLGTDTWVTRLACGTVLRSRYLIAATGLLSQPKMPAIRGLNSFNGKAMHSARWDHDYDLAGKRVAIIGTGATAVQIIPEIAGVVAELKVFQRTPIWVGSRPDRAIGKSLQFCLQRIGVLRYLLRALTETGIEVLTFSIVNHKRLPIVVSLIRARVSSFMRGELRDHELESRLIPDYELGCKRPTTSNTYLKTFRRDNVALITDRIKSVCPEGILTENGKLYEIDTLILATGFLTTEKGNAPSFEVVGRDSVELGQFWQDYRLQAYAGVAVPGFPNFFLTAGPYSGGFNWFTALKAHLKHILRCLHRAQIERTTRIEVRRDAHERYMRHMWSRADGTIFKNDACRTARSYYLDRRGDASLPLPTTPWWRVRWNLYTATRGYEFGCGSNAARHGG